MVAPLHPHVFWCRQTRNNQPFLASLVWMHFVEGEVWVRVDVDFGFGLGEGFFF